MEDYTGNSKKEKQGLAKPEKKISKVIADDSVVVVKKKGLGQKIKDVFIEADFRSVTHYVVSDVLIPALRNMIVDGASKGVERMMYGDSNRRRFNPGNSRITYNNPIHRPYSPTIGGRYAPPVTPGPRTARQSRDDIILASRDEGELVLERLNDIIDTYEVASVADLNDLLGLPQSHVDQKWGWTFVGDASVRQVREGYLLDLPAPEPLQ